MAKTYIQISLGGSGGTDDRRVKVSGDDSTPGFLEEKIEAGSTKVTVATAAPGANEKFQVDVDETQIDHNNLLNYDIDEHRALDDASTTTTSLWSSDKIQTELDTKINAATPMTDNKLVKSIGTSGVDVEATGIDVDDSNNVTGINNLIIDGDLTVNGTTTSVNSDTLDVTDANITVNNGGTQASADAEDAGITVEMSDATDAQLGYDSTLTSKFKVGEIGTESEVITANHSQTIINKTINADNNTISELETDNLKAGVVSTDLDVAVDNTKLAGSQAVKDYVIARVAEKDDASEITYTPADGTDYDVVPTHVDGALDELADRVNTTEDGLATHLNADPSKHNANQINNTPAGNIIATDVQGAIDELDTEKYNAADFDGDFDTRLATKSTDDVAEGSALYHTDERSQDAVGTILTDTASIDLTYDDITPQITAVVLPAGVDHDSLNNYDANDHIDHTTVSISAGEGLSGGGDISANRSLALDVTGLTTAADIQGVDELVIYDTTATGHRKVTIDDITSIGSSTGDLDETSYALLESQAGTAVTGFSFSNLAVRSFNAHVSVAIDATGDLFEEYEIRGIQKGADWEISVESLGDDSLVEFDISAAGQITYNSSAYAGFVSGTVKFRATVTGV
jgi:hypothetical protein